MNEAAAGAQPVPFQFHVDAPESWKRVIEVEVAPEHFARIYGRKLRQARKTHTRPGFRKGRVPLAMVEQDLGGEVRWQAIEEIIPGAFQAAVLEHKLLPVSEPEVEDLTLPDDGPLRFVLAVEVRPEVSAVDYKGLPLRARDEQLPADAVDQALARLREARAVWERVDRPAASGDRVRVDVTPRSDDGAPRPDKAVTDYVVELGGEGILEPFDTGLTGAAAGESREITVTYPDDHPGEELRGRTVTYDVVVKEVQQKNLPELDDAFASSLEEGQTLLELRAKLREELQAELDQRLRKEREEEIVDRLLERNEVALPPSWVDSYVESTVAEVRQRQAYLGREMSEEDLAAYRREARPMAERALATLLLLESIRRQEGIEVTPGEVEEQIAARAARYNFPLDDYRRYLKNNHEDERIALEIADRKTFDFLIEHAVPADRE